jgi:peroxiredoxin
LRRWEELRPELDARGIQIVTLCTDTPEAIRKGRTKHGLRATMLSDRDLAVTDRYNLRNNHWSLRPPGVSGLPVPATILADADGIVAWIDQSDDYQFRSDPDRVMGAIREALD